MNYDPSKKDKGKFKKSVELVIEDFVFLTDFPTTKAVAIQMEFHLPRPKSHFRTGRFYQELKEDAPIYPRKPDIDNLAKFVLDALNDYIWKDDSQVTTLFLRKVYANEDEPHTMLKLEYDD